MKPSPKIRLIFKPGQILEEVSRQRAIEVLTALHFLVRQGRKDIIEQLYMRCGRPRFALTTEAARILSDEGLLGGHGKVDDVVQSVVVAAVTYQGPGRLAVASTLNHIIQR